LGGRSIGYFRDDGEFHRLGRLFAISPTALTVVRIATAIIVAEMPVFAIRVRLEAVVARLVSFG
jgi:hypothetical protein